MIRKYFHEAFDANDMDHAMDIVLSMKDQQRFMDETSWLIDAISNRIKIASTDTVLDFGCGMGRLSQPLIEQFGCRVIGVDSSASMRALAEQYVNNILFTTVDQYLAAGSVQVVMACLVLQHVADPAIEIQRLAYNLHDEGWLVIVNEPQRLIPVGVDSSNHVIWHDDGIDIFRMLSQFFTLVKSTPYYSSQARLNFYRKAI